MTHVGWIFLCILRLAPSEDAPTQARYLDIATDIAEVAPDREGAAFLLGMASKESAFAWEADHPDGCVSWWIAVRRCDNGRARSMWQFHTTRVLSRQEQAREALRQMRASMA